MTEPIPAPALLAAERSPGLVARGLVRDYGRFRVVNDVSIQVRDTNDKLRSFFKDNIKEIRRDKPSPMPSYASVLSKNEIEDVVAYLSSLRGAQ